MKYAVVLGAVAVVRAVPQGTSSTSSKLPWVEYGQFPHDCGAGTYSDKLCGTQIYCDSFNMKRKDDSAVNPSGEFKTARECFDSHETKPASTPPPVSGSASASVFASEPSALPSDEKNVGVHADPISIGRVWIEKVESFSSNNRDIPADKKQRLLNFMSECTIYRSEGQLLGDPDVYIVRCPGEI